MRVLNSDGGEFTDDDIGKIPVVECTKEEWEARRKPPRERLAYFIDTGVGALNTLREWALRREDEEHGRFRNLVELFGTPLEYAKQVVFNPDYAEEIYETLELIEREKA